MPITAQKPQYRPFTRDAATRIAKRFGLVGQEDVLLKEVMRATETYERYLLLPNYHQRKDALRKLSAAIDKVASVTQTHERALELPLYDTVMRRLGEFLTYDALETLLNVKLPRGIKPQGSLTVLEDDEWDRLCRSGDAANAGPKLLVALFRELQRAVEDAKLRQPVHRGGKTKNLFRLYAIGELARLYEWFFDKPATSTVSGQFSKFCSAILEEMDCDLTGFDKAIPVALKRRGLFSGRQPPRSKASR